MSSEPKILAVETTASQGGIALAAGSTLIEALQFAPDADYACELLDAADRLCRQARLSARQIEQVYVSVGPGSFTGARIGVTFAKSLATACGARIVAVPTLQVLAANALHLNPPPECVLVLIDARRGQVYAEMFELAQAGVAYVPKEAGKLTRPADLPHDVAVLADVPERLRNDLAAAGMPLLPSRLSVRRVEMVHQIGWRMGRQGGFTSPEALVPLYFRLPTPVERLRAKASGKS